MRFDVVTLFPEIFSAVRDCGITARARMRGLWSMNCWNPRDTATDLHRTIDDRPFGGGPGMVMMAEPLAQTIDAVRASGNRGPILSFAPNGALQPKNRLCLSADVMKALMSAFSSPMSTKWSALEILFFPEESCLPVH